VGIRSSPRVAAGFSVRFRAGGRDVEAVCQDLAVGGMLIRAAAALPVNAVVRVELALPGRERFAAICRVVHLRELAGGCAMGVQFLELPADGLQSVQEFIGEGVVVGPVLASPPLNLLVVDDDDRARAAASEPFSRRGDHVRAVCDGLEALTACLKERPDVVLLDVQMPRMDGWQFLRMCAARPSLSSLCVVFLTSLRGDDERLLAYQLGADDFVSKPFRAEELVARVDRVVARARDAGRVAPERKTLRVDLEHVALPSLLAFLEMEKKTGELLVLATSAARLWLRDGRIVRVEREGASSESDGRAQLTEVLRWRAGQFEFAACDVGGPDAFGSSTTALLIDLARVEDERAADEKGKR